MIAFADGADHGVLWLAATGAIILAVILAGIVNEQRWLNRSRDRQRALLRERTWEEFGGR